MSLQRYTARPNSKRWWYRIKERKRLRATMEQHTATMRLAAAPHLLEEDSFMEDAYLGAMLAAAEGIERRSASYEVPILITLGPKGSRWSARADWLLMVLCRRLSFPGRMEETCKTVGGSRTYVSQAWNFVLDFIFKKHQFLRGFGCPDDHLSPTPLPDPDFTASLRSLVTVIDADSTLLPFEFREKKRKMVGEEQTSAGRAPRRQKVAQPHRSDATISPGMVEEVALTLVRTHPRIGSEYSEWFRALCATYNEAGRHSQVELLAVEYSRIRGGYDGASDVEWHFRGLQVRGSGGTKVLMGSLVKSANETLVFATTENASGLGAVEDPGANQVWGTKMDQTLRWADTKGTSGKWLVQCGAYIVPHAKLQMRAWIKQCYPEVSDEEFETAWCIETRSEYYEKAFKTYVIQALEEIRGKRARTESDSGKRETASKSKPVRQAPKAVAPPSGKTDERGAGAGHKGADCRLEANIEAAIFAGMLNNTLQNTIAAAVVHGTCNDFTAFQDHQQTLSTTERSICALARDMIDYGLDLDDISPPSDNSFDPNAASAHHVCPCCCVRTSIIDREAEAGMFGGPNDSRWGRHLRLCPDLRGEHRLQLHSSVGQRETDATSQSLKSKLKSREQTLHDTIIETLGEMPFLYEHPPPHPHRGSKSAKWKYMPCEPRSDR
ncbi:hypothetical protein T484DRAFT_1918317 [Baffinella frigidus]|nr:hypothetical protein T484DRAFT_1918317 [Cryptophyta sp. CCMP2293]